MSWGLGYRGEVPSTEYRVPRSNGERGMIDLSNRTALVTGGSRGIGRATALLLARAGADVGITYLTRAGDAEKVVTEIRGMGRKAFSAGGELGDPGKGDLIF